MGNYSTTKNKASRILSGVNRYVRLAFFYYLTNHKFKGLLSDESTVFNCRPVADNKQYVASLHAGHKKGVISVRDRTQFPTSKSNPPNFVMFDSTIKHKEIAHQAISFICEIYIS